MSFASAVLTNAGKAIAIRGMSGEVINFTKLKIGKGSLEEGQNPKELNDIIEPVSEAPITNFVKRADGIKIVASFQNAMIREEFDWSEIGLFVKDPTDENREILYAYQNAYEYAEHITPLNMVTRNLAINIEIDDTDSLTAEQHRELVYATLEDFDDVKKLVENYQKTIEQSMQSFYKRTDGIDGLADDLKKSCEEAVEQVKADCTKVVNDLVATIARKQVYIPSATAGKEVDIPVTQTEAFMFPPVDVLKWTNGATTQVNTNSITMNTTNFSYDTNKVKVDSGKITFNTGVTMAMSQSATIDNYYEYSSGVMNVTNYRDVTNFVYSEV